MIFLFLWAQVASAVFYGNIRYAAPLNAENYLNPPQLLSKLEQTEEAAACEQFGGDGMPGVLPPAKRDCLLMNVWTPPNAKNAPVIVYIHGGGFLSGSGLKELYDGRRFTDLGFVFVSFNYRLGKYNFSPTASPLALLDQAAALKWISLHVAELGGDPSQITLMGHSMGAFSVRRLVEKRLVPEGVNRAILFSPGQMENFKMENLPQWKNISLLQTFIYGESEVECVVRAYKDSVDSYLYVLHGIEIMLGTGGVHGSEVSRMFQGKEPEILNLVAQFARTGKPSPILGFIPSIKEMHWFSGWRFWLPRFPLTRPCSNKVSPTDLHSFPSGKALE